MKTMTRRTPS
uniref:Uncharacterized protein n=1 Tax=Arundo donax TaxID=35708 RepID=A0A0A9HMZ3_ARUDO